MDPTRPTRGIGASRWAAVLGLVLASLLGACSGAKTSSTQPTAKPTEVSPSGDIPDTQVYVPFVPADGAFSVKVPEGWARSESGTATTFTDKLNTVRIEVRPAPTAPTTGSATKDEVPSVKASERHATVDGVSEVSRPAGQAVLVKYQADAQPDPVTGKSNRLAVERYEFWRTGQEVVLTLSGPAGSDNVDPWKVVTTSFRWKS